MDESVQAVLDLYHARMAAEKRLAHPGPRNEKSMELRNQRLLAVGPETGQLINILARSQSRPHILELGTSYGYSGIWLAEAARATEGRLTTMELHDYKSAYAKEKAMEAGLADHVDFKIGDAVAMIGELPFGIDFVLLDLWKDLYVPCLQAFYPKLNPGAIIVADNMIRPGGEDVVRYREAVRGLPDMVSIPVAVGTGLEISRYKAP